MALTTTDWHNRFRQQAQWTVSLQRYIFERAGLSGAGKVLDVGCGTGALIPEVLAHGAAEVVGLDIDREFLTAARRLSPQAGYIQGDAHRMPLKDGQFDLAFCHFLLLWVEDPLQVLMEMRRVTKRGGVLAALAEPDYLGRVDYPQPLAELGRLQTQSLRRQGADPETGRKLRSLFSEAGLREVESGILGAQWNASPPPEELERERQVLRHDLAQLEGVPPERVDSLLETDRTAWQRGERVLFVPTFFAWARVP